jgi:hypothetical protein
MTNDKRKLENGTPIVCNCSDLENLYREGAKSAKETPRNFAASWRSLRLRGEV